MNTTLHSTSAPSRLGGLRAARAGRRRPRPTAGVTTDGFRRALPFLVPALVIYAIFTLLPMARTLWLSLTDSGGYNTAATFVGAQNYIDVGNDPVFWQALGQTVLWLAGHLVLAGGLGFVLALGIARLKRTQVLFRTAFFLPHVVSLAVVGVIWATVYDPYFGFLNNALHTLGLGFLTQGWLSEPFLVLFSVNLASSWQGFGLYMILFLAGLQTIDHTLYDAAEVDGATRFQKLVHVTLPGLRDVMTFVVSLALINGLKGFATVWVMTQGGPYYSSELITTYIYRLAFQAQEHGQAAVACVVLSLLAIGITIAFNRWREKPE